MMVGVQDRIESSLGVSVRMIVVRNIVPLSRMMGRAIMNLQSVVIVKIVSSRSYIEVRREC
jgi:hypothetical protein